MRHCYWPILWQQSTAYKRRSCSPVPDIHKVRDTCPSCRLFRPLCFDASDDETESMSYHSVDCRSCQRDVTPGSRRVTSLQLRAPFNNVTSCQSVTALIAFMQTHNITPHQAVTIELRRPSYQTICLTK